jgi:hypothetical protein
LTRTAPPSLPCSCPALVMLKATPLLRVSPACSPDSHASFRYRDSGGLDTKRGNDEHEQLLRSCGWAIRAEEMEIFRLAKDITGRQMLSSSWSLPLHALLLRRVPHSTAGLNSTSTAASPSRQTGSGGACAPLRRTRASALIKCAAASVAATPRSACARAARRTAVASASAATGKDIDRACCLPHVPRAASPGRRYCLAAALHNELGLTCTKMWCVSRLQSCCAAWLLTRGAGGARGAWAWWSSASRTASNAIRRRKAKDSSALPFRSHLLRVVFTFALFDCSIACSCGSGALPLNARLRDVRLGQRLDALNAHRHSLQQTLAST